MRSINLELELDRDNNWLAGGVHDTVYIRAYGPTLNKDGGWFQLPRITNGIIKEYMSRDLPVYKSRDVLFDLK